jgi:hypothetical protein
MQKHPVEPDNFKRFRAWLLEMSEMYGVESSKEVGRHVTLLVESLDRQIYDSTLTKKPDIMPVRKFIAIFSNQYRILTDYDYNRKITSVDAKNIDSLVKNLDSVGCSVDIYLKWFFESFLPNNEKMCPPTVGLACSQFSYSKFLYVHKDDIEKAEKQALALAAERELYRRAKELLEKTENAEIGLWTKQYRAGAITMEQWREHMNNFEKSLTEGESK